MLQSCFVLPKGKVPVWNLDPESNHNLVYIGVSFQNHSKFTDCFLSFDGSIEGKGICYMIRVCLEIGCLNHLKPLVNHHSPYFQMPLDCVATVLMTPIKSQFLLAKSPCFTFFACKTMNFHHCLQPFQQKKTQQMAKSCQIASRDG